VFLAGEYIFCFVGSETLLVPYKCKINVTGILGFFE
jgi:hypothetical protein